MIRCNHIQAPWGAPMTRSGSASTRV